MQHIMAACSCHFNQALSDIDESLGPDKSAETVEKIVELDWRLSKCVRDTKSCTRCSSDIGIIAAIQSRLEKLLRLLEEAYRTCDQDDMGEFSLSDRTADATSDKLHNNHSSPHPVRHSTFVLGRLTLSEGDASVLARSLITHAICRKACLIQELRERVNNCPWMQETLESPWRHLPQNIQAYNDIEVSLQALLKRVYSDIAKTRMKNAEGGYASGAHS